MGLLIGVSHFCWVEQRAGWAAFRGDRQVRAASFTSSPRVSESTLLFVRAAIFAWCFFILAQSSFYEGVGCLRFFTVTLHTSHRPAQPAHRPAPRCYVL